TLTQTDIDARSVSVEFDKAPTEGQYVLEEKVTDSTGNTVKFSDSRDVTLEPSSTNPSDDDDDGGSFGFGALFALLGLGLFRRRR
ncbi:GlyGly-CTERM sorting domain-containing protein, partial [Vibrio alginolyticus]